MRLKSNVHLDLRDFVLIFLTCRIRPKKRFDSCDEFCCHRVQDVDVVVAIYAFERGDDDVGDGVALVDVAAAADEIPSLDCSAQNKFR